MYRTTENSLRVALLFAKIAERDAKTLDLMLEEFQSLGHSFKGHCCRGPHNLPLLNAAVAMRSPGLIRVLFKYKVDLDLRDDFNRTAVYVAVKNDQPAILDMLLEAGARPDIPDRWGDTPFLVSVRENSKACFRILLRRGASPDSREHGGRRRPVLTIAAGLRDVTIARELLRAGANVNAVDEEGMTALHKAVQASGLNMLELLLFQYKAQPDIQCNSEGVTPAHYALLRPDAMSFLMLLALAGSKFEEEGRSLKDLAEAYELPEVRRFIIGVSGLSRHARLMSFRDVASIEHGLMHDEDFGLFRASKHELVRWYRQESWEGQPERTAEGEALMDTLLKPFGPQNARYFAKEVRAGVRALLRCLGRTGLPLEVHRMIVGFCS